MNNTNNESARASYLRAKEFFRNAWLPSFNGDIAKCNAYIDSLKMSQTEIRLEVGLTATATQFKFALTGNMQNSSGVQFLTENRLDLQDSLICNEMGIFVAQTSGVNDTAYQLSTYGNTQRFAAADAAALNSTFYSNGSLRILCNKDVIMPYRGLFNFLYKPQTQQTAALGAGSPDDEIRGAQDGMITVEPNILLIGSKGYDITIDLKTNLASAAANMRAVIIFRGVLAQNSTPVS